MSTAGSGTPRPGLSYRDAGVDIDAGDALVERIKSHVRRTHRPEVLGGLGGFAGLCALPARYKEPLLVSCTDGVGTKLKLAFLTGRHDTVGIDLVAMNVNDLVVCGGEPLFFLDYFASGKLEVGVAERVIAGIADGCQTAGCALLGRRDRRAARLLRRRRVRPGRLLRRRRREEPPRRRHAHPPGRPAAGPRVVGLPLERLLAGAQGVPGRDAPAAGRGPARAWASRWATSCCGPTRIYVRAMQALARGRPAARRRAHHGRRPGRQPDPHAPGRRAAEAAAPARAAGKCRRSSSSWPAAGASRPRRCAAPSTWASAWSSACRPTAPPRRPAVLERAGEKVFAIGQVAAADAPDAPVEFLRA